MSNRLSIFTGRSAAIVAAGFGLLAYWTYLDSRGEPHGFVFLLAVYYFTGFVLCSGIALAASVNHSRRLVGIGLALLGGFPFVLLWFI